MLAVLKKRWKPNRAAGSVNNKNRSSIKSAIIEPIQLDTGADKIRHSVSPRQVHPEVCPAPNICVQAGRIEFIKPQSPISDIIKEKLEARIAELETELEAERRTSAQEKENRSGRLQDIEEQRDSLAKNVEVEREARQSVESRLEEAVVEADFSRRRLHSLQQTCHRLEDSVRSMSLYKSKYSQLKMEHSSLNSTVEGRMQQFQTSFSKLSLENEALRDQLHSLQAAGAIEEKLRVRLEEVEEENGRLIAERAQCEKCLDQVAHQVVQALLSQKILREEISTLKGRVKELEKQNYTLSSLLLEEHHKGTSSTRGLEESLGRPMSCEESRLKWRESLLWFPVHHRPSSLNLDNPRLLHSTGTQGGESQKDEGYSTMSSEVQAEGGDVGVAASSSRPLLPRSCSEPGLLSSSLLGPPEDTQLWWEQDPLNLWLADPTVDFDAPPELEEWAMDDIPGLSFLADPSQDMEELWFSMVEGQLSSPSAHSWSSQTTSGSKRSSTMSESDPSPAVGTHFTRDFYTLVKFESTKSLASTSSRSQGESGGSQEREQALQSMLQFIAEQEQYCECHEEGEEVTGSSESLLMGQDSGVVSKSSDLSSSEDIIREPQGLLTVPEEEESLTSSISTPETVLHSSSGQCSMLEELKRLTEGSEESEDLLQDCAVCPEEDGGCPTGWVHVETSQGHSKIRANLMDVVMSRSSSSCSSESGDDHSGYQHLHRLHRSRRHKKASASRDGCSNGALRVHSSNRASIIGRQDLFIRYGAKEREAVASFDFLEELTSGSSRDSTVSPR